MEAFFIVGIVQVVFSIVLIGRNKELLLADKVLILFLTVCAVELGYSLVNFFYTTDLPDFIMFPLLLGPLVYMYTHVLTSEDGKLPDKYYLHLLPFVAFLGIALLWYRQFDLIKVPFPNGSSIGLIYVINFVFFLLQSLYYWRIIRVRLVKHQVNVQDTYSIESPHLNLSWLKWLSKFVFGGFALFIIIDTIFYLSNIILFDGSIFLHCGLLIAIYSFSFWGFRQEAIFEGQKFKRFEKDEDAKEAQEVELPSYEDKDIERLMHYLAKEKPFLQRNLTIGDLAEALNMVQYRLSELINVRLEKNFFTLINEYRVEEAKSRILAPEYQNYTLAAIGFDSGFNSKSSFHDLFKKHTGLTPSQFRKENG
jgi:AraC-like DNA-binding protein